MWYLYVVVSDHSAIPATDTWSLCHAHTEGPWYSCEQYPVLSKGKEKVVEHSAATIMSSVCLIHSIPFHFLSLLEIFDLFCCSGKPNKLHNSTASREKAIFNLNFSHAIFFYLNFKITFTLLETVWPSGLTLFLWLITSPETFPTILVLSQLLCTLCLYLWFFHTKFTLCTTFIIFDPLDLSI